MGLKRSQAVVARAHVLIAEAPGAFPARVAVEHAIDAARWCQTETVADADVLVVIGSPGPELMAIIDHTWAQMSEPRARVAVEDATGIESAFATARADLVASADQPVVAPARDEQQTVSGEPMDHTEHEQHEVPNEPTDHTEHEQHEHGGHDHGSMSPDGISLAEGAEDRDGLEMDQLHLPLGPVLNHWPAAVVLHLTLNGDVVTHATGERLDFPDHTRPPHRGPEAAARLLDSAASLLTLAGLPAQSARARHLRHRCLTDESIDPHDVNRLATTLSRLRILRWLWRGTTVNDDEGRTIGLHDQLVALVERAAQALRNDPAPEAKRWPSLHALPELIRGQELATVRLWVAALGADAFHCTEQGAERDE